MKKTGKNITCQNCDKTFYCSAWELPRRRFCSQKCFGEFHRLPEEDKKSRREVWNDYNHKTSTKKYKREWHERKFFGTDGLLQNATCEICSSQNDLVVHHVDGNNGKRGKKINNDTENLAVLCRSCHPTIHNRWWLKGVRV